MTDEQLDLERSVKSAAIDVAIDQLCDVLHVASEHLRQMKFSIDPAHKYTRKHCPKHLHALGVAFARATVESMEDEPPLCFRSLVRSTLEEGESVCEDMVIDAVREGVLRQLREVLK